MAGAPGLALLAILPSRLNPHRRGALPNLLRRNRGQRFQWDASGRICSVSDNYSRDCLANSTVPRAFQNITTAAVFILKQIIIGSESIVLPGTSTGDGVSVGALSVVNKLLESWEVLRCACTLVEGVQQGLASTRRIASASKRARCQFYRGSRAFRHSKTGRPEWSIIGSKWMSSLFKNRTTMLT